MKIIVQILKGIWNTCIAFVIVGGFFVFVCAPALIMNAHGDVWGWLYMIHASWMFYAIGADK